MSGKEKGLIAKFIIITVLIAAFFVGIIFAFYNNLYAEKRASIIKDGKLASMQAADVLENYLTINIDSVSMTAYALNELITEKKGESDIQEYLINQSTAVKTAVDENSTGFYGYIYGRFFSGTNWEPPADFDATVRPWYTKPLEYPGEITVLEPYHDVQSGNEMLALGCTLCDGVSVVSLDVSLDRIQAITENATMLENADTEMILNENGIVIAHSSISEVGKDYAHNKDTLGAAVFAEFARMANDCFEISFGGRSYIVYATEIRSGWHSISVMDATSAFGRLNVLLSLTIAAAIVMTVIIAFIMIHSGMRQLVSSKLNSRLSSMADIYISLHEIDFFTDTFSVIRSTKEEVTKMVGSKRSQCQDMIKKIMESRSDPSTRDKILDFVDFAKLNHRLKDCNTITCEFLSIDQKWRRARFIVSERVPSGKIARAMYVIEDIDSEKRERDTTLEAVNLMNEQISSVANIYFSMHDIDLPSDSFIEIKTKVKRVSDLIGGRTEKAQETMYAVMDQMTDPGSRKAIREFVDFSTLNERLKNTNTITEEFLSHKGVWSRARFVVSKRAPDGSIQHVLWLVEGIDAEKRRRDRIINLSQQAIAANEAKSSFLSKMSHNIRTSIHSILGMNELILRECDDKNIRTYSENIRTSGSLLLGLVNDILDISNFEAGRTQLVKNEYDISCMISDLVNMVQSDADSRGLALTLDIGTDIPKVLRGDDIHLKQIIMNLLTNAINVTSKGSVTFSMHYEGITADHNGIVLDISIKDTSSGMKREDVDMLLSGEGGLNSIGLNIAESLLKIMGSKLKIESVPGLGSVYFFRIKQEVVSREPLGDYEKSYKAALEKRRTYRDKFRAPDASVLVADDIPMNLMLLTKLLEGAAIHADTALSGDEAIKLAESKQYDLIILDQIMPEKNGVDTLREIREDEEGKNASTPVVCLTANAIFGAREQYLREGFDDYLTKPLDPEKLGETLLKFLPAEKIINLPEEEKKG